MEDKNSWAGRNIGSADNIGPDFTGTIFFNRETCKLPPGTGSASCLLPLLPVPVLEISDTAFIIQMLEQSRGLSFLPLFAVQKQIWEGTLAAVEVDDVEISMYRQIFYHKNKFRTREMEQFIIFASEEENH